MVNFITLANGVNLGYHYCNQCSQLGLEVLFKFSTNSTILGVFLLKIMELGESLELGLFEVSETLQLTSNQTSS